MMDKKKDDTNLSSNRLYNDKLNGVKEKMQSDARDEKMLDTDLKHIINEEERLREKLKESSYLERFTTDVTLFISLVKDYYQGNYRDIPYKAISAIVIGLLYVLNPIDIIPDFIPVIGYIDDAIVIAFCLKMVEKDLLKYQTWKLQQSSTQSETNEKKA